jgi:hypothetical protein
MSNTEKPLRRNESGPFAELSRRPNPRGYVIAFTPPLVEWLERAEGVKGAVLSVTEVARVRDGAPAIALTKQQFQALMQSRGGKDIDPRSTHEDWERQKATRSGPTPPQ